jgi:WD40 repeat protein
MADDDPSEEAAGDAEGGKKEEGAKKKGLFGRFGKKGKGEEKKDEEKKEDGDGDNEDGEYSEAEEEEEEEEPPSEDEPTSSDDEPEIVVLTKTQQKDKVERMEEELLRRDEEKQEQENQKALMAVEDDLSWEYAQNFNTYLGFIERYEEEKVEAEEQAARDRFQLKLARTEGFEYKNRRLLRFETWKESPAIHLNYKGHATAVHYCCISDDWHRILSCSSDKTVKLWDRISGECLNTYTGHTKGARYCDMPPGYGRRTRGGMFLSCGWDRTIRLWNADTGFEKQCITLYDSVYQVKWGDETCRTIFAAMEAGTINVYDADVTRPNRPTSCCLIYTYKGPHTHPVAGISFSPSGRYLMSWGSYHDSQMCLWLAHTGRRRLPKPPEPSVADKKLDAMVCERCGKLCTAHELVNEDDINYDPMAAAEDELPPEPPSLKKKLFMAFGVAIEMSVPMEHSEVDWATISDCMDPMQQRRGKLFIEAVMDPLYPTYVEREEVSCKGYQRAGPTREKAKEEAKKAHSAKMNAKAKGKRNRRGNEVGEGAGAVVAVSKEGGETEKEEEVAKEGGKNKQKKKKPKVRRVRKKKRNPLSRDALLDAVGGPGATLYEAPSEEEDEAILTRALFRWTPERDDELAFEQGDIVMVDKKDTGVNGWWLGHLQGMRKKKDRGLFPYNLVMEERRERIEEEMVLDMDDPEVIARLRRERKEKLQAEKALEKKCGKELWAKAKADWLVIKEEHEQKYDVQQMRLEETMLIMEEECYRELLVQREDEKVKHDRAKARKKGGAAAAGLAAQEEEEAALAGKQDTNDLVARMERRVQTMIGSMASMSTPEQLYKKYCLIEEERTGVKLGPPLVEFEMTIGDVAKRMLRQEEKLAKRALTRRRPEYLDMPGLMGDEYVKHDAVGVSTEDKMRLRRGARAQLQGMYHEAEEEQDWRRVEARLAEEQGGLVYTFSYQEDGEELQGHDGWVNQCTFSRDETRVASAGSDGLAKVWDPMGGKLMQTLRGHDDAVTSVAFSKDGKTLVTASSDRRMMVWRLLDSMLLTTVYGHSDVVNYVQFIREDVGLISCSTDCTIKTWQLVPTVPDAPTRPTCTNVGMRELVIHWEAPLCYNSEVTNYILVRRIGIRQRFHQPILVGQVTHTRITDLLPGRAYQFKVAAINAVGQSHYSPPSPQTIMDSTVPDTISPRPKVCAHDAAIGPYSMCIMWTAPDAMGSPVQTFRIDIRGAEWGDWGDSPPLIVPWADVADQAQRVAAAIADADQAQEEQISLLQKHLHKIEAKIRRRKEKLFGVSEKKTLEELEEEQTTTHLEGFAEGSAQPMAWDVQGLRPGFMYQFRISAINAIGESTPCLPSISTYTSCLPPTAPPQPVVTKVEMHSMRVTWQIPDMRGSPMSGYLVKVLPAQTVLKVNYDEITKVVEGLEPGLTYCFQVAAVNRIGQGEYSKPTRLMMTKKGVPAECPPPDTYSPTPVYMELKWQPCAVANGSPLTQYVVAQREGGDDDFTKEFALDISRLDIKDETKGKKNDNTAGGGQEQEPDKQAEEAHAEDHDDAQAAAAALATAEAGNEPVDYWYTRRMKRLFAGGGIHSHTLIHS